MRSTAAALQRLKDPRVPGTLLGLLVLAFGCTPSMPRYPMGGVQNGLDEDIAIRGNARGASFDATLGPRSALWVIDNGDDDARVEVYGASGYEIDRHVRLSSYGRYYDRIYLDRLEVVKSPGGISVRQMPWDQGEYRDPYRDAPPPRY